MVIYVDNPKYIIPDQNVAKEMQRKWLMEICVCLVETYVMSSDDVNTLVQKVKEFQEQCQEVDTNRSSGYFCRIIGCGVKYVSHSNRVK